MITRAAIKQMASKFGEPVILRVTSKAPKNSQVLAHCAKALTSDTYVCFDGPSDGELVVFDLRGEEPQPEPNT